MPGGPLAFFTRGAIGFMGLATAYAVTSPKAHIDWVLTISGPLLVIGALFLWSWRARRTA